MDGLVLAGITVLELSQDVAGPFCTKILAEMGAQVIKIEPPGVGDSARQAGPFPGDIPNPEASGLFLYLNTGKKSITLDLKSATGQQILKRLVERADILVESFAPGTMEQLGLGYPVLEKINRGLIMASITPFGQTGPYKDYKSEDLITFAMGGIMSMVGDPDRAPVKLPGTVTRYFAGVQAYGAAMVALLYRELSGEGQYIDVSMMEVVASHTNSEYLRYAYEGGIRPRTGNTSAFQGGIGQVQPTQDDGLILVAVAPWQNFCELIEKPELVTDPRFATREERVKHGQELNEYLAQFTKAHPKEELFQRAQEKRVTWAPINTVADLFTSPQLQSRDFFKEIDHPVAGALSYPGNPVRLGDLPTVYQRAPLLGEHNEEVYTEMLGYSGEDVVKLRQVGII